MRNYILRFKDNRTLNGSLLITSALAEFEDSYIVEIWDVNKDYHSLKPLDIHLKAAQEELKTCKDESRIEKLKSILSFNKYGNKRILVPKNEMWYQFEATTVVYTDVSVPSVMACVDFWPYYTPTLGYKVAQEMRGCSPLRITCVE